MTEFRRKSGIYVSTPDNKIASYETMPETERYNMERLRYQTILYKGLPAKSAWFGSFHGIEGESAHIQEEVNTSYPFSRVEAWVAHELAYRMNSRSYLMPLNEEDGVPGKTVSCSGVLGKLVDLNRQYVANGSPPIDWQDVIQQIPYGPAQLPLQLVRDNPDVEIMISIHEDPDRSAISRFAPLPFTKGREGIYIYDVRERPDDPQDPFIEAQMRVFGEIAYKKGFDLFSGRDDGEDETLKNRARNGLIRQSVYDRKGRLRLDGSFEMYLVYLQSLGLGKVKRSLVIEVPSKMEFKRKKELITTFSDTFLYPVLGALNIW